jgi:ubiquinone/menaquinone biosynthesis C-methylase UbiE
MWTSELEPLLPLVKQTKYLKTNPLRQFLIRKYLSAITSLVVRTGVENVLDVGCGEGFVTRYLSGKLEGLQVVGTDLDVGVLAVAQVLNRDSIFLQADIYNVPIHDRAYDLVLCNEVLEHLRHPERALKEIERVTRQYSIISVPREPHYRLANLLIGANLPNCGDDPDHRQRWTYEQLVLLLKRHFEVLAIVKPVLWTVALCRVPTTVR